MSGNIIDVSPTQMSKDSKPAEVQKVYDQFADKYDEVCNERTSYQC